MTSWYILGGLICTVLFIWFVVPALVYWFGKPVPMNTSEGRAELEKYGFEFEQVLPSEPEWRAIENEG